MTNNPRTIRDALLVLSEVESDAARFGDFATRDDIDMMIREIIKKIAADYSLDATITII